MRLYFTSTQPSSVAELGIDDAYAALAALGNRLRVAMGEEVLPPGNSYGGEFRPPTFRSMAARLDRGMWSAYSASGVTLRIVPYNELYDGWQLLEQQPGRERRGFMVSACSPGEYAHDRWQQYTQNF